MTRDRWLRLAGLSAAAFLIVAPAASAQVESATWHKGTALALFGGASTANDTTDGVAGGMIGWELTPRLTFEGAGFWRTGHRSDTFSALVGTRINLLRPRPVVPFVSVGAGVHRSRADRPLADGVRRATADHFAVGLGGGVDIALRRHLTLRPDVRVLLMDAAGGRQAVTLYGVSLAYHFEEHIVTP